jgi:putative DNA primase/helicase
MTNTLSAALEYAENGGWRLFPATKQDGRLRPLVGWKNGATTNPRVLADWFTRKFPTAFVCVATGVKSGIVVVDVDLHGGPDGHASLKKLTGDHLPATPIALTPRGGLHLFFAHPGPGKFVKTCAGEIAPAIDVRGDGGMVPLPPAPGREWHGLYNPWSVSLAPLPAWVPIGDPPTTPLPGCALPPPIVHDDGLVTSAYGESAVMRACAAIETAANGQQEMVLNRECFGLGQLVAGGEIAHGVALTCLAASAGRMVSYDARQPWSPRELSEKLQRAFEQGLRSPRRSAA